jgi:hypothetical protein
VTTVVCLGIGIAFCLLLLFGPRISEGRARRKQEDAAEERASDAWWAGLAALPLDAGPEEHAADVDRNSRSAQQAHRDYEASRAAGYVESLADWDLHHSLHPNRTRKEHP